MVADLLRLKLLLLRNSLRRSPWQIVGLAFGALYGLGMLALLYTGLFFLSAAARSAGTLSSFAGPRFTAGRAGAPDSLSAAARRM